MLWDGAAAVYLWKFAKKHSRSGHTTRVYFGYAGLLMLCVGLVLGALMSIGWVIMEDMSMQAVIKVFLLIPIPMLILGELFALFWWVTVFRKASEDESE